MQVAGGRPGLIVRALDLQPEADAPPAGMTTGQAETAADSAALKHIASRLKQARGARRGKTRVQATAYQLFGPLGDPAQSSVRTRGVDLSATYQATAKSTFTAYATRKTIEFLGGASGAEEQGREDRYTIVGVSAQYAATRTVTAWAGADYQ